MALKESLFLFWNDRLPPRIYIVTLTFAADM